MAEIRFRSGGDPMRVGTVYCIGRNYVEHARELNNPVPKKPMVFLKPASSIIHSGDTVVLPPQSSDVHHEVEVVVVFGKGGRHIPESDALSHVAGYAVGIDLTARDIQSVAKEKGHPWSVAKGFATFAPLSEALTPAEAGGPGDLSLSLRVNGDIRQQGGTRDLIFSIPTLIAYLSGIFQLEAGDLIYTGTPEGVAALSAGDRMVAELNGGAVTMEVAVAAG